MKKQLIFIDDSGDPGFKPASSPNFVMAAAVFDNPETADSLSRQITEFRNSLGWRNDYEFKFAKIRKDIIVTLLRIVTECDFRVYAVYINKAHFRKVTPALDNGKLYNWAIKELLEIIPLDNTKIKIDGRSSKDNMRKTATYLRRSINADNSKKLNIKFEESVNNNLIQLADLIAGSIHRHLNDGKTDYDTYFTLIRKKVATIKEPK